MLIVSAKRDRGKASGGQSYAAGFSSVAAHTAPPLPAVAPPFNMSHTYNTHYPMHIHPQISLEGA